MTKILDSRALPPLTLSEKDWVYNSLDCCLTFEILEKLLPELDQETALIYDFARALQAPILEMMLRGTLVDEHQRGVMIQELKDKKARVDAILQKMALEVWGQELNPNSPKQLQSFFYSFMQITPVKISVKGERKVSTNREALEKLRAYIFARPFVNCILALRDFTKLLSVLKSGVDADQRMRTSYNIGGTETGRLSSSENAFGTGTNKQNLTERVRVIFVADPGKKLAYVDLEQAESRAVAYLSEDEAYIQACESGDLHTTTCKMVWKELPWTDDPARDKKEVAGKTFYRDFTYRDMAKRGGHGSNYLGTPWTMARHLKVDTSVIETFHKAYFSAFPGIRRWHYRVARDLQLNGILTTPLGRRRCFFGRRNDDATLREAVAYQPQSMVGDILNLGLWKVWKRAPELKVEILEQVHDAILIQYPEELEDEILPQVIAALSVPVSINSRLMTIPAEAQSGWNWGKFSLENPDGLTTWSGNDRRKRSSLPRTSILDRRIC